MTINETISYCKSLEYYSLQDFAGKNFNKVYKFLHDRTSVEPNDILIPSIFTCIAIDGKLNENEWKFISNFIGGYTYEKAFSIAGEFYCKDAQDIVKNLFDTFTGEVRDAFLNLCIAVLCVDKRVDGAEVEFLRSL